jgi:WhiB family redox-sensing transcriptional regulator
VEYVDPDDIELPDLSWMRRAECRSYPTEVFFPVAKTSEYRKLIVRARKICEECPVRQECLDYALRFEALGFWGGLSEIERRRYRNDHNITFERKFYSGRVYTS